MVRQAGLTVVCVLVALGSAFAQVTSGSVAGVVRDTSGLPVPGVTITVTNVETNAIRTVVTGGEGVYRVPALQVGGYSVKAELEGFQSLVRTGITLTVNQEVLVDFELKPGELHDTVTVSGEAPIVGATVAQTSGLVGEREVKDLPLNGRSFDTLITLNPGTVDVTPILGQGGLNNSGNKFAVAGRRRTDNLILLNGVEYTASSLIGTTPGGVSGQLLGIDAVREFAVVKDTYSAEYGKRMGGQVNVVTMSGANTVHGTGFEFLRDSAFDARNFFDQKGVPPFLRNNFGGAAGGPIVRSKAFVFANYEGFRQRLGQTAVSLVPDANARLGLLPDRANPGQFVNVGLSPAVTPYLTLWPMPNGPSLGDGTARFFSNPKQTIHEDFATARLDLSISPRDALNSVYTFDDGTSLTPSGALTTTTAFHSRAQVFSLEENHTFSSSLLNTARAGYSRAYFSFDNSPTIDLSPDLSFVAGRPIGNFVVTGLSGIGSITTGVFATRQLLTVEDKVTKTKGKHFLKVGLWLQSVHSDELTNPVIRGQATFPSLTALLQGKPSTLQILPNPTLAKNRQMEGAWYAEDELRVRSNLTLSAGLRHEFTNGWQNANGCSNFVYGDDFVYETTPVVGRSCLQKNNAKWLFGPRFSVAWDPSGSGKTALHGAVGMHYSLLDDLGFFVDSNTPFNTRYNLTNVTLPFHIDPAASLPASTIAPQGMQPDIETPATVAWSVKVDRAVGKRTSASVAYVGAHGYHGIANADYNIAQSVTLPDGTVSFPAGAPRRNPQLGDGRTATSVSRSNYHALEVDVAQRLSSGLAIRGNYTLAKAMDISSTWITADAGSGGTQNLLNPFDPELDYGPSSYDVRHRFSLNGSYELPFGEGKRWLSGASGLPRALATGWQLNTIVNAQSGFPFSALLGFNRSRNGDSRFPDRPDTKPGTDYDTLILGDANHWFDASAFTLPAAGTYGNTPRNALRGPGLVTVALSLFKNIALPGRASAQFRAEAFNLLNHTNLGLPNNNVLTQDGSVAASAGLITRTATTSRQIQFGLKLMW